MSVIPFPVGRRDIIRELGRTVSASRLNTFHQCRLKFYFRYVLEIEKSTSPSLFIGKTVHAVLQAWNLNRWRGQTSDLHHLFEETWTGPENLVDWKGEEESHQQTAWAMLETYFQETNIPEGEKPQGVEVAVEADLVKEGLPKLVGIIDLVRPGGKVVDFKTTSTTPNPERTSHQNELQLTCYALLYREGTGEKESGFELHHLVKLKTPKVVIVSMEQVTENQIQRLYRAIESYLDGLVRMDFVPSPGMSCLSCEYFRECRKWAGTYEERRAA